MILRPLGFPLNKLIVTRNDDEISASPRNIGIYMILFEQNCNNLKMAAIGRNMWLFLLLNTIINPYYHSCVFMTIRGTLHSSKPFIPPTPQLLIQWLGGTISGGWERPVYAAELSTPASATVKSERTWTSISSHALMMWCVKKHTGNFISTFIQIKKVFLLLSVVTNLAFQILMFIPTAYFAIIYL